MKIVDRILLNDNSYLKEFFTGYCEIIDMKVFMGTVLYNIRTTYLIDGQKHLIFVKKVDIKPINEIRNYKLKELGI